MISTWTCSFLILLLIFFLLLPREKIPLLSDGRAPWCLQGTLWEGWSSLNSCAGGIVWAAHHRWGEWFFGTDRYLSDLYNLRWQIQWGDSNLQKIYDGYDGAWTMTSPWLFRDKFCCRCCSPWAPRLDYLCTHLTRSLIAPLPCQKGVWACEMDENGWTWKGCKVFGFEGVMIF